MNYDVGADGRCVSVEVTSPTCSFNLFSSLSMRVELIVITGLARGTAAPIQVGHYLIGRHQECQIRPESRNVSRRHCLLWNDGSKLGASDLESSWGTFVNEQQLKPHVWKILKNGDTLRVGDFSFQVRIHTDEIQAEPVTVSAPPVVTPADVPPPPPSPEDVASDAKGDSDTNEADESETATTTNESDKSSAAVDRAEKRRIRAEKYRRPKRSISLPSIDLGESSWKLLAAILAAVLVFGYLGYSVYRFQTGSPPEIREGLD